MPIRNEGRMHIEFNYEFPFPDSQGEGLVFPLRFHHTEEMGPTITFLDQEGKPTEFHLPAIMFAEVAEYLVDKGVIEGRNAPAMRSSMQPVAVSSGTRLGLPIINRDQRRSPAVTSTSNEKMQKIKAEATPIEIEQVDEDETETQPQDDDAFIPSGVRDGLESVADVEPVQSFTPEGVATPGPEAPAPESKPERKPRLAPPRTKLSVSDIRAARASANPAKRIKPLS